MADDNDHKPAQPCEHLPSVAGQISALASANAPFIFFESAHLGIICEGSWAITLTALRPIDINADGTVAMDRVVTANLRGSMTAMFRLREQINALEQIMNRQAGNVLASVPTVPSTRQ